MARLRVIRSSFGIVAVLAVLATVLGVGAAAAAPSASGSTVWLCRPGQPGDACGGRSGAPIDCFYVYPTVSLQLGQNANRVIGPEERVIAAEQAAPFGARCNVWAPMYRQSTLRGLFSAGSGPQRNAALAVAFSDIRAAWTDYLAHHNAGRGVVLIGHSQGTLMLRALMRESIDGTATRDRIVSAILLGGNVLVRSGATIGGDFSTIPLCTARRQFGCVVAYSTFGNTPPADTRYGRVPATGSAPTPGAPFPAGPDLSVACTNPAALGSTATAPIRGLIAGREVDGYRARCTTGAGPHVLQVSGAAPIPASALPRLPNPTWGTHLLDVNLAQRDLIDLVGEQTAAYLAAR